MYARKNYEQLFIFMNTDFFNLTFDPNCGKTPKQNGINKINDL